MHPADEHVCETGNAYRLQALHPFKIQIKSCVLCALLQVSNMENSNTRADLERIKNQVLQHLQSLPPVPSVAVAVMPPATRVSPMLTKPAVESP